MKVLTVDKKIQLDLYDIVRFQITLYCFLNKIKISPAQLDSLAYLGVWGEINISDFCEQIVNEDIFGNPQTVRNFILKCVRDNLIERKGLGKKIISLSQRIELYSSGNILINMKVYHVEANKV
jgi:hypothetical protein|tara:strand:- start:36704 stop:37072 length:369 start_codon:yes stop_codon:yes gene_type:complete